MRPGAGGTPQGQVSSAEPEELTSGGTVLPDAAARRTAETVLWCWLARVEATKLPNAWPSTTADPGLSLPMGWTTSSPRSAMVTPVIAPVDRPIPRGWGRRTRSPWRQYFDT